MVTDMFQKLGVDSLPIDWSRLTSYFPMLFWRNSFVLQMYILPLPQYVTPPIVWSQMYVSPTKAWCLVGGTGLSAYHEAYSNIIPILD